MLKKLIASLLAFVLLLSCCACGGQQQETPTDAPVSEPTNTTDASTNEAEMDTTVDSQVEVNQNLLTVELTFPASYFGGMDMSTFDTEAYIKEYGFLSAEVNEDDSLSVLMTKAKQKELLNEMATAIDDMIADYVNGEETPYIKEIVHNEDFSSFTMKVNRKEYENSFDATEASLILNTAFYHMYAGIVTDIEFKTIDADTGEIIESYTY